MAILVVLLVLSSLATLIFMACLVVSARVSRLERHAELEGMRAIEA